MNSFGKILRVTVYGTSHNQELGVIIDGCPAGIEISENDFIEDIVRRKSGSKGTTPRIEDDAPMIRSGLYNGRTNGTPLLISFLNKNIDSEEYNFDGFYRPGHADFTASVKYRNFNDPNGGGQFSGRMTLALVAAGVVAKKITDNIKIRAVLKSVNGSEKIEEEIHKAIKTNDSVGGVVECNMWNIPAGLGEPFFDSIESLLSHAVFSIPGAKAIEFGEGIKSASAKGSEFNDVYVNSEGKTKTNNNGSINGGITNGNDVYFRVYFKPTPSIRKEQETYNFVSGKMQNLTVSGKHDVCYALRTPVVVEAVSALVIADLVLLSKIY